MSMQVLTNLNILYLSLVEPLPSSTSNLVQSVSKQDFSTLKKSRTQFSPKQLLYLEERFIKNHFPSSKERSKIAKKLELTPQHIQVAQKFDFELLQALLGLVSKSKSQT